MFPYHPINLTSSAPTTESPMEGPHLRTVVTTTETHYVKPAIMKYHPHSGPTPVMHQEQAEDLSMRPFFEASTTHITSFLQFCDIILKYTNYPDAFPDHKPKVICIQEQVPPATIPKKRRRPAVRKTNPKVKKPNEIEIKPESLSPVPRPPPRKPRTPRKRKSTEPSKPGPSSSTPYTYSNSIHVPVITKPEPSTPPSQDSVEYAFVKNIRVSGKIVPRPVSKKVIQLERLREEVGNKEREATRLSQLKYETEKVERAAEAQRERERKLPSPLNSVGESGKGSTHSSSSSFSSNGGADNDDGAGAVAVGELGELDDGTWNQVTCWCGQPFAGRAMIECESCFMWLHLRCAGVSKKNIPETFVCSVCVREPVNSKPPARRRKASRGRKPSGGPQSSSNGRLHSSPSPEAPALSLFEPSTTIPHSSTNGSTNGTHSQKSPPNGRPGRKSVIKGGRGRRKSSPFSHLKASLTGRQTNGLEEPSVGTTTKADPPKPQPRRRPTINSASSGLYENALLPLELQIGAPH